MNAFRIPTSAEEQLQASRGIAAIAGVDEAGAGAWAGPVYAAAVILKAGCAIGLIRDSKMLSPSQRERAAETIRAEAVAWAVGQASAGEIDNLNIRRAGALAMRRAIDGLDITPGFVLIDAFSIPGLTIPSKSIIRGDATVVSIAAASIIAKVARDDHMTRLAREFPGYGFEQHKGYGTKAHQAALRQLGPCPEHRKTYAPVKVSIIRTA